MNEGMNVKGPSNDEYQTPAWLFRALDSEFGFTLDGAANETNHLCPKWTDNIDNDNGLARLAHERVFCNPPYSLIEKFVKIALFTSGAEVWVLLLPARTGTRWFQLLNENPRVELRFLRKRVKFCLDGKEEASPRFDSVIAIVWPK